MHQAREALVLKRFYPAAPEKVWRAWIEADALRIWFGQSEAAEWQAEMDVRVGGRFRVLMVDAKGEEFDLGGIYREVIPARRLVMTWGWKNQPGHESLVSVDFRPLHGGTQLELRHDLYIDFENQPTHEQGWNGAFDKLELLLKEQS